MIACNSDSLRSYLLKFAGMNSGRPVFNAILATVKVTMEMAGNKSDQWIG